jgi:hypothetical protein
MGQVIDPANPGGTPKWGGPASSLNLTSATAVRTGAGILAVVTVIVAGSAPGTANDCTTTGAATVANQIVGIPNTVGAYQISMPYQNGLVIVPGTGQTVAISYS